MLYMGLRALGGFEMFRGLGFRFSFFTGVGFVPDQHGQKIHASIGW